MLNKYTFILLLLPLTMCGQTATQIFDSTGFSNLRSSANTGVYSHKFNKSYFTFIDQESNPYVVECDHGNNNTWGTPMQLIEQTGDQSYNYSTIALADSDRVIITYAAPFDTYLGVSVMITPNDMNSFESSIIDIGQTGSKEYPRIHKARNGTLYIFFSSQSISWAANYRSWYSVQSTDNGLTWSTATLRVDRGIDDPDGISEATYFGSMSRKPYTVGEPELWYFPFTSSGGAEYTATHDGGAQAGVFIDSSSPFDAGGAGFLYRVFYNLTTGEYSQITNATGTTLTLASSLTINDGDSGIVAYHNIFHVDNNVFGFAPETAKAYSPDGTYYGDTLTRLEIDETNVQLQRTQRPIDQYIGTAPPGTKRVTYVPMTMVDSSGIVSVIHSDSIFQYNPSISRIDTIIPSWPGGDARYFFWYDSTYYSLYGGLTLYNSDNLTTWNSINTATLTGSHGYALYANPVLNGNAYALVNAFESNSADNAGYAWAVNYGTDSIPRKVFPTCDDPTKTECDTFTVNVYITDETYWSATRLTDATNEVTLTDITGNSEVLTSSVNAVDGVATFSVRSTNNETENIELIATSDGLESDYIRLYVTGDGESECPTSQSTTIPKAYFGGNGGQYFPNGKLFMR